MIVFNFAADAGFSSVSGMTGSSLPSSFTHRSNPKPVLIATQEFLDDQIYFRNPAKEKGEVVEDEEEE